MQMGDGKPKLWKCVYPAYVEGKINFMDQKILAEGTVNSQVGLSTEKQFRELAEKHLENLMPDADYKKAWFKKDSIRASGCYWNTSVLIIPISNSHNYYAVRFFS